MTYKPTKEDMELATLLCMIADGEVKGKEAETILRETFPNVDIKWTREDIEDYLVGVYSLVPIQVDKVIEMFPKDYISPTDFNPKSILYNFTNYKRRHNDD